MKWRTHVPEGCPPDDAKPAEEVVFRLIKGDVPEETDFLSYKEENRPYAEECVASGLSVYTSIEGIYALKRKIKSLKSRKVISGTLTQNDGMLKNTPSNLHISHHTWWLPDQLNPVPLFIVVEQIEES